MKRYTYNTMKNALILVFLLAVASCSSQTDLSVSEQEINLPPSQGAYELTKVQFESSGMKTAPLAVKTFHEVVKTKGMFDVPPENRASVSSYFGGSVKDIRLLTGERVKKGQLLFTLENPDFVQVQQAFLEAQGQLAYLKSDYERQKNLAKDSISSQKNFLKSEAEYTVTRVKVESLSKTLTMMGIDPNTLTLDNIRTIIRITSPISGYITQVDITQGAFLSPSQSAVTIMDTNHLHLELNIFEKDLSKVSIGLPIQFRIQEDKSKDYKAVVHLVNKTVDPESRMIGIHGHLSDDKLASQFNPGMYVEADIYATSASKPALPQDALVELNGKYYALVLDASSNSGYSFVKKEVKVGISNNDFIEVLNPQDFKEGALFLTKGAFNLITE